MTLVPVTVATPVKSSMRSSLPAARLEFCRGRVKALITLLVPELEKLTLRDVPVSVMAFLRLKSMPNPVLPGTRTERVATGTPVVVKGTLQTLFAGHWGLRLVMAAPVPLKNASWALVK